MPSRLNSSDTPRPSCDRTVMKAMTRRQTLLGLGALAGVSSIPMNADVIRRPHIATNTYPWGTFAKRAGETWPLHSDELLGRIASTGITGYEPAIFKMEEFEGLGDRLKRHGLEMRSLYVNTLLHDAAEADKSIDSVLAIAAAAKELGTRILVTNPSPIRWGGPENKSDAQLQVQATNLERLGGSLAELGMQLAYHNHDIELREGGREFHHMLTATKAEHVKFCLDAHWVYRGCGNSEVALFDVLEHYHDRIIELHLRQSKGGIWSERFTVEGDIDYARLFAYLKECHIFPHLVLEQAIEEGSPDQLEAVEAHRLGREALVAGVQ